MQISNTLSSFTNPSVISGLKTNTQNGASFESSAHIGSSYNILDYNAAVASTKLATQNLKDFQKIVNETTNPEEKKRFEEAIKTTEEHIAKNQSDIVNITSALHLDSSITSSGKMMSWDGYEAYKANGYKSNASILGGLISMNESDFASYKDYYDKNVKKSFRQSGNMDSIDFMA